MRVEQSGRQHWPKQEPQAVDVRPEGSGDCLRILC